MAMRKSDIELIKKKKLNFREKSILTWHGMQDNKISYLLIAPFMIVFTLFVIIPVASSFLLSLTRYDILNFPKWVGFDNYLRMFLEDEIFLLAVKNTLQFAVITGPVGYLMCFTFAWFINDMSPKARAFYTVLFYAPQLASMFMIFTYIFSSDYYGLLNYTLMNFNLIKDPIQWLATPAYALNIVILIQLWLSLGTGFLALIAGFQSLDAEISEAGAIDGIKNKMQELIYIILPQMRDMLFFSAIMQITASFSVGSISAALLGNPSVDYAGHTIVLAIGDYGGTRFEMGYSAAMSVFLFVLMLGTKQLFQLLLRRIAHE